MKTIIKSKSRALLSTSILIFVCLAFVACTNDDTSMITDDGILRLLKQNIGEDGLINGAEDIPVESSLTLVFSHSLNTEALGSAIQINAEGGNSDYEMEFSNSNSTLTITPATRLEYETNYTIIVPEGAYGTEGESLDETVEISFKTAAYVPPVIKLSTETDQVKESAETLVITAELDKDTDEDVAIMLDFSGEATLDEDYSVNTSELIIPAGELSTSFELTTIPDQVNDDNETVLITIASIENATDNDNTRAEIKIT